MSIQNNIKIAYDKTKDSAVIGRINAIISSGFGIAIFSLLTILSFWFSLELYLYALVAIYVVYVSAFADDLMPIMPWFLLCYVSPSTKNNVGVNETSIFYGATGKFVIVLAAVAVLAMLIRIGLDKGMGYKRMFTQKRALLNGMLALGATYLLSGVGSEKYFDVFERNLLFSFIQFMSIFLLYFFFSATVDWKRADPKYFAWTGLFVSAVVVLELIYAYHTQGFGPNHSINHSVYVGWGISNNMGCMIMLGIPFCFYLSTAYKRSAPFMWIALILLFGTIFTGSRAASLIALGIFPISYAYAFKKCRDKAAFLRSSLLLLIIVVIFAIVYRELIANLLQSIPNIYTVTDDGVVYGDAGRFPIYLDGLRAFFNAPIFGQTFYPQGYDIGHFSTVEAFNSFFPPRWHNTVIQILASCGVVGMVAYSVHRIQTIKLFAERRNPFNTFTAIVLIALLANSLLDCHLFNVGPAFLYSMALAFAEFSGVEEEVI